MSKQLEQKKREHHKLATEARKIQEQYRGKEMPVEDGKRFKDLTDEAYDLQIAIEELERDAILGGHKKWEDTVPPGGVPIPEDKSNSNGDNGDGLRPEVAAYLSPGQAFIESKGFQDFSGAGFPKGASAHHTFQSGLFGRDMLIPLDRKLWSERQKALETKALPTLGSGVIDPQRVAELIKSFEFDRLVVRDLVTVGTTTSNVVEFVRMTSAQPTTATTVSDALTGGSTKPESTIAFDVATAPVRTLAVWMPVTEQQLADFGQIRMMIDQFLRFDIMRLEEYQSIWGDGTGTDLLGIMDTPNVTQFTRNLSGSIGAGSTVTILDKIRGAMSDVQVLNYEPNGVIVHPFDFEQLVLQKGSDDHYLRQVFPTEDGQMRVFSLRIVVTNAAESYRDGLGTHQRVAIIGDFRRGATLWDRMQASVEVGFIDKQFIQNTRTIRAEERVAFAVWRPRAFKWIETVAASAS
ncbi:MAG: phage major capsid protein [Acidimicrobiia bacterium]